MPFDNEPQKPSAHAQKIGLKKQVSSQPSMFDNATKKPTQQEFEQQVKADVERGSTYKSRAADLTVRFNKALADKTLPANKNQLQIEVEREILINMVKLAQEVNTDGNEREGEGSLSWIIVLLKTCFAQRDRMNVLEYRLSQLEKKNPSVDKPKQSE